MLDDQRYADAVSPYLWLWTEGGRHDADFAAERYDLLVDDLIELVENHVRVRRPLRRLRDAAAAALRDGDGTRRDFDDWMWLNHILDDTAQTLAWFDRTKDNPAAEQARLDHLDSIEYALVGHDRYADLLRLYPDVIAFVEGEKRTLRDGLADLPDDPAEADTYRGYLRDDYRYRIGIIYAAALEAGREEDARRIVALAAAEDDTVALRAWLVDHALWAGQPRPEHRDWLREAAPDDEVADLRAELDALLTGPAEASPQPAP